MVIRANLKELLADLFCSGLLKLTTIIPGSRGSCEIIWRLALRMSLADGVEHCRWRTFRLEQ
jgi:hypothetical protein